MKPAHQSRMCGTWPKTSLRKDGLGYQETLGNPLNARYSFFFLTVYLCQGFVLSWVKWIDLFMKTKIYMYVAQKESISKQSR